MLERVIVRAFIVVTTVFDRTAMWAPLPCSALEPLDAHGDTWQPVPPLQYPGLRVQASSPHAPKRAYRS